MPRTNTKTRLDAAAQQAGFPEFDDAERVRWTDVDATVIRACVDSTGRLGWALTLGYTSDQGALSAHVLADGTVGKNYFPDAASCEAMMRRWTEYGIDRLQASS